MEFIENILIPCILLSTAALLLARVPRKRWWVRPWIMKRDQRGTFPLINGEFNEAGDHESFKNFLRMDKPTFDKLLNLVKDDIEKQSTLMRTTLSPRHRLIVTLRFLATGESFQSLHYTFRLGKTTIASIVPEVCEAIYRRLKLEYLKVPKTTAEWLNIAAQFNDKWNFPNALGAMDGKHILFRAPLKKGSAYRNYKHQNSIVLLGVVDADYKFIYIDCGKNGRVSDGGVFQKSSLAKAMAGNKLNFPEERPLPGRAQPVPLVIVADAAFPLQRNILKPFPFRNMSWPQRIYNYRLSRARRVVENAFGILANRWRVLLTVINLNDNKVQLITLACCALHNFLLTECPIIQAADEVDDRIKFCFGLAQQGGNRARHAAVNVRNEFMEYFNNEGAVPWQNDLA